MHEGVADNKVGERGNYYHGCTEIHMDFLVGKGILPQPDFIKIDGFFLGYKNCVSA